MIDMRNLTSHHDKMPVKYILQPRFNQSRRKENAMENWKRAADSQMVCYCRQVRKGTIIEAIKKGCSTLAHIQDETQACTGSECVQLNPSGNCCSDDILELLKIYCEETADPEESGCCCC
jgi:NAD(P)H-nitrite reductase large subunit